MLRPALIVILLLGAVQSFGQDSTKLYSITELRKENPSLLITAGFGGSNPLGALSETATYDLANMGFGIAVYGKSVNNNSNFLFGIGSQFMNYGIQRVLKDQDSVRLNFNFYTAQVLVRYSPKVKVRFKPFAEVQAGLLVVNYRTRLLESSRALGFREKLDGNNEFGFSKGFGLGVDFVANPRLRLYAKTNFNFTSSMSYGHSGSDILSLNGELFVVKDESSFNYSVNQVGVVWAF